MHKSFDELVVQPDLTTDYELAALECPLFLSSYWSDPFETSR